MSQQNKAAITRLFKEGWVGPNIAIMNEILAPDVVDHGAIPGMPDGRDGYIGTLQFFNSVFTDWTIDIQRQAADGDLVSTHLMLTSKHTGDGLGMPATGKTISIEMMLMDRFANGLVAEEWLVMDNASMMGQITG